MAAWPVTVAGPYSALNSSLSRNPVARSNSFAPAAYLFENTATLRATLPDLAPALDRFEKLLSQDGFAQRMVAAAGAPFKGVLFAGLMITAKGPQLIEYNVRFGDPECQVLMLRLMSDLVPALLAACAAGCVSKQEAHNGAVRFLNAVPDAPLMSLYIDDTLRAGGYDYARASPFTAIRADTYPVRIDELLPNRQGLRTIAVSIVGLYFLKGIGSYFSGYLMEDVGQRVVMDLRDNGPFPMEMRCHNCNTAYAFEKPEIEEICRRRLS